MTTHKIWHLIQLVVTVEYLLRCGYNLSFFSEIAFFLSPFLAFAFWFHALLSNELLLLT